MGSKACRGAACQGARRLRRLCVGDFSAASRRMHLRGKVTLGVGGEVDWGGVGGRWAERWRWGGEADKGRIGGIREAQRVRMGM